MDGAVRLRKPVRILVSAIALASASLAGARPAADFAPLAVGNKWIYTGTEKGGGFWWNFTLAWDVRREIVVDSSRTVPGGVEWFLSYRDSCHHRTRSLTLTLDDPKLPDTLFSGRFRVLDLAQSATLRALPFATDRLPAEMASFFRAHNIEAPGDTARVSAKVTKLFEENCAYQAGKGLTSLSRNYDVWNTAQYTPPYRLVSFTLSSFTGAPSAALPTAVFTPGRWSGNFAPMEPGRSWRWRALKRRVFTSSHDQVQDSLIRHIRVTDSAITGDGKAKCRLQLRDSLFARLKGTAHAPDTIETAEFELPCGSADTSLAYQIFQTESGQADMRRFFDSRLYPESMIEDLALPGGTVKAMLLRDGMPGLFTDTLVYAQGIGFIRRAKMLYGNQGMTERMEYELIELDGKPFAARPVRVMAKGRRIASRPGVAVADALGRKAGRAGSIRRFGRPISNR
jgi:hypothetical protein